MITMSNINAKRIIMKRKNIIYYLSLAMLLGACTEANEIDNPSVENEVTYGDRAITFGNSLETTTATKGVVIEDLEYMKNSVSMGVYSYMTAPGQIWGTNQANNTVTPFLDDYSTFNPLEVSYSGSYWSYGTDVRYWPSDGSLLHFYAWAPYNVVSRKFDATTDYYPVFSYSLNSSAVYNEDLLWAPAKVNLRYEENPEYPGESAFSGDGKYNGDYDLNSDGYINGGTVHFDFSHAMSRISIYARVLVSAKSTDPTDINYYERFGINGVTFYNVVGSATAEYNSSWEPSWALNTTDGNRVNVTASQGNTLLEHYNSIRTAVGQVPKVDKEQIEKYNETTNGIDTSTFGNVMMATYDDAGDVVDGTTHGIYLFPQTFSEGGDSPDANIDIRVRHYNNSFISVVEAEEILWENKEEYWNYIYCVDTDGDVAVVDFEKKEIIEVTIHDGSDNPYEYALDPYDMEDDDPETDPNGDLGGNYYFMWDAAGDYITARYYFNPNYGVTGTTYENSLYICYTWTTAYTPGDKFGISYDNSNPTPEGSDSYDNEDGVSQAATITVSYTNTLPEDAILRYQCVKKDTEGSLYSSTPISLTGVFTGEGFDTNDGLESGQHAALYFTFDITDGEAILVPMTVYAEVLGWVDVNIDDTVDDQLVIYCDTQTLASGDGTVTFYTKCQDDIAVVSVSGSDMTVSSVSPTPATMATYTDFKSDPIYYTVAGSTDSVAHTVTYTGATSGAYITITIEKTNGQKVTKTFTFDVTSTQE